MEGELKCVKTSSEMRVTIQKQSMSEIEPKVF